MEVLKKVFGKMGLAAVSLVLILMISSSFRTSISKEATGINSIDTLYVEVESGEVEHPILVLDDDYALGDQFIQVEDGNKSSSEPPGRGKVTLSVDLTGGDYTIWGRTIALDDDSDSFWVQVNDGEIYNWNGIPITPFWGWSQVKDFRYREVVTWSLPAGTHTITIYYREPNTKLDALFITNTETVPTRGDDQYPPNLVNLKSPPTPWQNAYNFSLPDFEFTHPMTVISRNELEMVKHYVNQQVEPQHTAYFQFIDEAEEAQSFVPDAPSTMEIMGGYEPNSNLNEVREQLWRNCHAAYSSGLAYAFTGETRYADKAVEVMMDWANANTTFTGGDRGLQLGSWFSQVLYAADLIHDYEGWSEADREIFKSWWRNNVLVHTLDVLRGKDNNWKDAALLGVFTASIVLEDTLLLKEGLIQLKSYFYERVDESVRNPGVDWKIRKDENGIYLPREVVRNDGRSGLTYTAYAMTSMVQCLDIAKYAGFNLWEDSTSQGGNIKDLMETYFQWDIMDQRFPWNGNPNKSDKRRNSYELANVNLQLSDELIHWIESNRPQVAREGDEYATLTKGDIHISKLVAEIDLVDNQTYAPGDTIAYNISINDPYQVGLDQIEVFLNGEIQSTSDDQNVDGFLIMPDTPSPLNEIKILIRDGFGVEMEQNYTALNSDQAKRLELDFNSEFGSVVTPNQSYYPPGEKIMLTAIAKFPYSFKGWGGDSNSSTAEIEVVMDDDVSLEAVFELREDPQINFNFQHQNSRVPVDYRTETGEPFSLSDEVQSGWRAAESLSAVTRTSNEIWDARKLSYIQMQSGSSEGTQWEMEIASGLYNIEIGFGDPGNQNHVNSFRLEEQSVSDPDGKDSFDVYRFEDFSITDGHLTITPDGENVKINYLKIATSNTPLKHFLAVQDGTGEGEFAQGEEAPITANAASGTDLFEWVGDLAFVDDISSNETFVVMPNQDVEVSPSYVKTFELLVGNGSGAGNYREGALVEISADVLDGRQFIRWTGDTEFVEDINSANTTLTMTNKATSISAEFESILGLESIIPDIRIYPNPAKEEANLSFTLAVPAELSIEIIDLSGRRNFQSSKKYPAGDHSLILREELTEGVNIVRFQSDEKELTRLLVKR